MSFSTKLRMLIEENQLTQKELAKQFHISASTLGGYVQGTSEPNFAMLADIARYFHVSTDYLLSVPTADTRDEREEELLRIYRSMSPDDRNIFLEQGRALVRIRKYYKSISSLH